MSDALFGKRVHAHLAGYGYHEGVVSGVDDTDNGRIIIAWDDGLVSPCRPTTFQVRTSIHLDPATNIGKGVRFLPNILQLLLATHSAESEFSVCRDMKSYTVSKVEKMLAAMSKTSPSKKSKKVKDMQDMQDARFVGPRGF
eukprot:6187744-Pleurochrysis_carterae.AAC.10